MECGARFIRGVVNQFVWDSSTTAAVCDEVTAEILRCGADAFAQTRTRKKRHRLTSLRMTVWVAGQKLCGRTKDS
jgi:hypothetical protein